MQDLTLVIGNKSLSSWSLRPWLFLKHHGVSFKEFTIDLDRPATRAAIVEHSPSGRVPVLKHGNVQVWESLAICEYAAETFALPSAWPMNPPARALARSVAAEMHAGFADLRKELPFQAQREPKAKPVSARVAADIARIRAIWRQARKEFGQGGEWLFGKFGIVDAMFAPVALRFHHYAVPLDGAEREYVFAVYMHPAVQEWIEAAAREQPAAEAAPAERTMEKTVERTVEKTASQIAELVKTSLAATPEIQLHPAAPPPPAVVVHPPASRPPLARRIEPSLPARPALPAMGRLPEIDIDHDEMPPASAANRTAAGKAEDAAQKLAKPAATAAKTPAPTAPKVDDDSDPRTEPVKKDVRIQSVIMPPE